MSAREDATTPNADDLQARRITSLALHFTNRAKPTSSEDLWREFYPEQERRDTVARMFRRDRELLEELGVYLERVGEDEGSASWRLDTGASLAGSARLSPRDALLLELACRPLAADPSFPYADELSVALVKVSGCFDEGLPGTAPRPARAPAGLRALRSCHERRVACRMRYVTADGRELDRVVAVLGFFGLRDRVYAVAATVGGDGSLEEGGVRTYRCDRVASARPVEDVRYEVPGDFSVDDHRVLPFQIGDVAADVTFLVPACRAADVRREGMGKGAWEGREGGELWTVGAADLEAAAAWAVAAGVVPLAPEGARAAWHHALEASARRATEATPVPCATPSRPRRGGRRGRKGGRETARLLVALLGTLEREGGTVSADVVSNRLGISRKEALNLIELLSTASDEDGMYLPLYRSDAGDEVSLSYDRGLRGHPLRLTVGETRAVVAALQRVGVDEDDPTYRTVVEAFGARREGAEAPAPEGWDLPEREASFLEACVAAIYDARPVTFRYRGTLDSSEHARHVLPTGLRQDEGAWLVDADDLDRGQPRTFRLDRMRDVRPMGGPEDPGAAGDSVERHEAGRRVRVCLADRRALDLLDWPGLEIEGETADGWVCGTIDFYGGSWLPRRIAACAGTAWTDDDEVRDLVAALCREQLGAAGA